ncbi:MAG: prepilin-type N-terminal cleavage/methylation domain-containing protein, partial [Planctomycetota bacterium]
MRKNSGFTLIELMIV